MSDNEETQEPTIESLQLEIDQLKDAVAYYKKKSEEESPSALHAEVHRLRRACRAALGYVWSAERAGNAASGSSNRYARLARVMGRSSSGSDSTNQAIVRCLASALNDAPPNRIEIPRSEKEVGGEPEESV